MVQYGRPSCSSWNESVRSSFSRTIMGKAIWEKNIETWLGENSKLGMSLCTPGKRGSQWRSRFGRTNIFPWSCLRGMHSETTWKKQRYCWQLQSHVWITNFRGRNWKTSILREISYFFVVLRYGGSCKEMCGAKLWVCKQDDSTTLQSIYSMHRWPSLQRGRIEICRRIVKSML